jgi:hypothetical protein
VRCAVSSHLNKQDKVSRILFRKFAYILIGCICHLFVFQFTVLADSKKARAKKTIGLGVNLPVVQTFVVTTGIELFFNVGSSIQLAMEVADGKTKFEDGREPPFYSYYKESEERSLKHAVAKVRWFLFNSLNVSVGAGVQRFNMHTKAEVKNPSDKLIFFKGTSQIDSLYFPVSVGSVWTADNGLFWGADWYSQAFAYAFNVSSKYEKDESDSFFERRESNAKSYEDLVQNYPNRSFFTLKFGFSI